MALFQPRWKWMLSLASIFCSSVNADSNADFSYQTFDCNELTDDLSPVKNYIEKRNEAIPELEGENEQYLIPYECLNQAIRHNYFTVADYLVDSEFTQNVKRAAQAEQSIRNAVKGVQQAQERIVSKFEMNRPLAEIPVLTPAFKWAQSLKEVFLEVTFTTRLGSPACLDLSEQDFHISEDNTKLFIRAMCKNDKKLIIYQMELDLYDQVMPVEHHHEDVPEIVDNKLNKDLEDQAKQKKKEDKTKRAIAAGQLNKAADELKKRDDEKAKKAATKDKDEEESYLENRRQQVPYKHRQPSIIKMESVGRLYIELAKGGKQKKWPRLTVVDEKKVNQGYWWDMHNKYEKELQKATDDSDTDDWKKKKQQAKKNKKNKKKKGRTQGHEEL